MDRQIDNIAVYKLIKKLSTPFKKWRAFKHGVIDDKGNVLKTDLTSRNEKDSFTKLDLLALNLKREMAKLPGGASKLASYAAALYLVKENESLDIDSLSPEDINNIREYLELLEDVPANHTSSSAIAGLGVDSISPAVRHHFIRRHREKAKATKEKLKDE